MKKIVLLVVCMVFLMAGMARADSLELVSGGTSITIYDPNSAALVPTVAGPYTVNFGPSSSNYQSYQAFCVDPAFINWNFWYNNYTMIPVPTTSGLPSAAYREAAYIVANYASTPNADGAAAQAAVWEVVFQQLSGGTVSPAIVTNSNTLTNPPSVFWVDSGLTAPEITAADTLVANALANGSNFDASGYALLVSPDATNYYGVGSQDFLVKVPESGTILLLGFGLLALFGVARKRVK